MNNGYYSRMLDYFQRNLGIESATDLDARINTLDMDDISIIYARWGIDDGHLCWTFKELNKKLKIKDSNAFYHEAEKNLKKAKFVLMLKDYQKLPFALAYRLGVLGCAIFGTSKCNIYGEQLWCCISKLPKDNLFVIETKYGLWPDQPSSYEELCTLLQVSKNVIKHRENAGLHMLNSWRNDFIYEKYDE